jgi:hypothetical protein
MPRTEIARPQYVRDSCRHASDTKDAEWVLLELLEPVVAAREAAGREASPSADIQDRDGAPAVRKSIRDAFSRVAERTLAWLDLRPFLCGECAACSPQAMR